jgi:predicted permease
MFADIRQSLRSLFRSRGLCVTAIGVITLAAAIVATVFSFVDAVLLRPLPVASPHELYYVYSQTSSDSGGISRDIYSVLRNNVDLFRQVGLSRPDRARLQIDGYARTVSGEAVSSNYFEVLGVPIETGRSLMTSGDDTAAIAVISDDLYRAAFGGKDNVIGETVVLKPRSRGITSETGQTYTIVGVADAKFKGLTNPWESTQYWVIDSTRARDYACDNPNYLRDHQFVAFGRLRREITPALALQIVASIRDEDQSFKRDLDEPQLVLAESRRVTLPFDLSSSIIPSRLAIALFAVCGLILAIAVSNLVGVLLARTAARQNEYSTRLILGGRLRDIAAGIACESLVLSVIGCALGTSLSALLNQYVAASIPSEVGTIATRAVALDIRTDWRVGAVMLSVAAAIGLLIALPLIADLRRVYKGGTHGGTVHVVSSQGSRQRFRRWIVVPQIAFAITLLTFGCTLGQFALSSEYLRPGYKTAGLAFVEFELPRVGRCLATKQVSEEHALRRAKFGFAIESKMKLLTNVESSALTMFLPLDNRGRIFVANPDVTNRPMLRVTRFDVGTGYFAALSIPILQGEDFDSASSRGAERVVVISREVAERLWPSSSPLGQWLAIGAPGADTRVEHARIVGIVGEVAPAIPGSSPTGAIYVPFIQGLPPRTAVFRYQGPLRHAVQSISEVVLAADGAAEILRVGDVDELIETIRYPRRLATVLFIASGAVGMGVTSIGLFGLLAYSVQQRTREIGVRKALGAADEQILWSVVKDGLTISGVGALCGVLLAVVANRVASTTIVDLPRLDIFAFFVVLATVLFIVAIASYMPSRSAVKIDPAVALRQD